MKTILCCNNLIGDSIYLLKPVDLYLKKWSDCVALTVLPQLGGKIVKTYFDGRIPIFYSVDKAKEQFPDAQVLYITAGRAMELAAQILVQYKKQVHISQVYAMMLGTPITSIIPPLDWLQPRFPLAERRTAIIAPFSASCARHSGQPPNKTLDDWKWEHIVRFLRRHGFDEVLCVGAPGNTLEKVSLPLTAYRGTSDLVELQEFFQSASLVICVEGGMGHLASLFDVPTVILWPQVSSMEFLAPAWAPRTKYFLIGNPNEIPPAAILYGLKKLIPKMMEE